MSRPVDPVEQTRRAMADVCSRANFAARIGVTLDTMFKYGTRGILPDPDGFIGTTPWWHATTIDAWVAERPGRGRPPTS